MSKEIKMRMSFTGIERNALAELDEIEALAKEHPDYDEYEHQTHSIRCCISAYRDTILALCKGGDIEEIKDFWFHHEDPKAIPYHGDVLSIKEIDDQ